MIKIGDHEFDRVSYDPDGDVLYLSKGEPQEAWDTLASPEGHAVRLDRDGQVIGLTLVSVQWLIEERGETTVTVPEQIVASGESLESALAG